MEKLNDIVFYAIDKAIRSYRQFAQKKIREAGFSITIDQWLVIKAILENPTIAQNEISTLVFKDNASVTRIIGNLIRDGYLLRELDDRDKRRTKLTVTKAGLQIIEEVQVIVDVNRKAALEGLSSLEIEQAKNVMIQIAENATEKL